MKAILALTRMNLRLALRERSVIFFNYFFPLIFFFVMAQFMGGATGGSAMVRIVAMVLVIGILGSGLFGAGMRAVMERETGILRRYKVTPITPVPILVSSLITGWLLYLPSVLLIFAISHWGYRMPWPERPFALLAIVTLGCFAFRAIGMIIASVANSMAESNILIQLLYMPMLFLSGATIPISAMPVGAQIFSQFLPAAYLTSGMQHVLLRSQGLGTGLKPVAALILSTVLATFVSSKLFRWEKDEKLPGKSKLWVVAVLMPFVAMGLFQLRAREQVTQAKALDREIRRNVTRLIRGATILAGDGSAIRNGSVLLKNGRIEQVFADVAPSPESLNADPMEAAGKTLLPGLIDVHVHLGASGGATDPSADADPARTQERALAAYLYSGVVAVRSVGDFLSASIDVKRRIASGERTGAELFACGPLFTVERGHGTEYFRNAPALLQEVARREFTRLPRTADEAKAQVKALKAAGVDCIKAVLESGAPGMLFQRMDRSVFAGIAEQAHAEGLPLAVHTGDARDVADAVAAGAASVEHGSFRDRIPPETFAAMREHGIVYVPGLAVVEAFLAVRDRNTDLLARSLVEQTAPPGLLDSTRKLIESNQPKQWLRGLDQYPVVMETAMENLRRAHRAGVKLATGTDAGNLLVIHGPTVQREIALWVKAGIPVETAIAAATGQAAALLGAGNRLGFIKPGHEASVILVDGNPLTDLSALEHISTVFLHGERIDRPDLFDQK